MTTETKPKVFGTGLIALDLVIGPVEEAPIRAWAGGTCGNVLSILAFLGWDAYPIARMNSDMASKRVRADMAHWGVHLDHTHCAPTAHTPIIVQEIKRGPDGSSRHRFSWSCPYCGKWLPGFRPITVAMADSLKEVVHQPSVFFLDRLSRGALNLARDASASGALVVFEPSSSSPRNLMLDATRIAHVVKYADNRLDAVPGAMGRNSATLLEIQTLGGTGVRYRHHLGKAASNWMHLKAIQAPRVTDTCGSGDWCTAGLLDRLARGGQQSLRSTGPGGIRNALRFGQALAAWNCGFEGARGGMYAVSRNALDSQIDDLRNGEPCVPTPPVPPSGPSQLVPCPSCPPE